MESTNKDNSIPKNESVTPSTDPTTHDWTGNLKDSMLDPRTDAFLTRLCNAFALSPYMQHNQIQMRVVDGKIQCYLPFHDHVVGNTKYGILHGGVTASVLDSIGGIEAMRAIYAKAAETGEDVASRIAKLATIDMHLNYLNAGRGTDFIGTAEILSLGRKTCTTKMQMVNEAGLLIATATAVYVY